MTSGMTPGSITIPAAGRLGPLSGQPRAGAVRGLRPAASTYWQRSARYLHARWHRETR